MSEPKVLPSAMVALNIDYGLEPGRATVQTIIGEVTGVKGLSDLRRAMSRTWIELYVASPKMSKIAGPNGEFHPVKDAMGRQTLSVSNLPTHFNRDRIITWTLLPGAVHDASTPDHHHDPEPVKKAAAIELPDLSQFEVERGEDVELVNLADAATDGTE